MASDDYRLCDVCGRIYMASAANLLAQFDSLSVMHEELREQHLAARDEIAELRAALDSERKDVDRALRLIEMARCCLLRDERREQ